MCANELAGRFIGWADQLLLAKGKHLAKFEQILFEILFIGEETEVKFLLEPLTC